MLPRYSLTKDSNTQRDLTPCEKSQRYQKQLVKARLITFRKLVEVRKAIPTIPTPPRLTPPHFLLFGAPITSVATSIIFEVYHGHTAIKLKSSISAIISPFASSDNFPDGPGHVTVMLKVRLTAAAVSPAV
jgi:hypothetical protein